MYGDQIIGGQKIGEGFAAGSYDRAARNAGYGCDVKVSGAVSDRGGSYAFHQPHPEAGGATGRIAGDSWRPSAPDHTTGAYRGSNRVVERTPNGYGGWLNPERDQQPFARP
jgi:hypothetical protein